MIFGKKDPQKEILKAYDELCDNLAGIKYELGRAITIESRIRHRLENNTDDAGKVGLALKNAREEKVAEAEKDTVLLERKLLALGRERTALEEDYATVHERTENMRKAYDELLESIRELQRRYKDTNLAVSEAKIMEISNRSYEKKRDFDAVYQEFEDETYHKLFQTIAERELDSKRVCDALTEKYLS